ncbi:MAG TPA: hypothetical protein PKH02_03085 [Bacteroidales bacterium]|nr:hypothetical protein [Bacteroidales bacterium]HPT11534.1 hypothetical protein [Bacteroidales bacterium]
MIRKVFCLLLFSLSTTVFGQIGFEPGYIIFNDGSKIECQIKNIDWLDTPEEICYLMPDGNNPITIGIQDVLEFGIDGVCRYIRRIVQIDISGDDFPFLTSDKNPVWNSMSVFLKVLVQGEASLYSYQKGNIRRYFYSLSDSALVPLIYKRYLVKSGDIATNYAFRQQLWTNVRYPGMTMESVRNLEYDRKPLEKYFIAYNRGNNTPVNEFTAGETKGDFNLRITSGIVHSTLIVNSQYYHTHDWLDPVTSYRVGLEAEYILPFNKNRMSVVFEPTFQHLVTSDGNVAVDYPFIEYPLGLRYYKFYGKNTKAFIDAFYSTGLSTNFKSRIEYYDRHVDIFTGRSLAVGAGIDYKRISLEARYYTNRDLCRVTNPLYDSFLKRISIVIGLKLF